MAKDVRIKLDRRGVRELLRSDAVGKDLSERGRRIAEAAAGSSTLDASAYEVTRRPGKNRQRVSVLTAEPEAMVAEAKHRTLTRALDAGR